MKIFGWSLLIAGVLIIFWALYSSYNIFTAQAVAPEIFPYSIEDGKVVEQETLQAQIEEMISEQLKGILPADFLPKILNLITWSVFAGISIFAGAQIASLGIKLIKKP